MNSTGIVRKINGLGRIVLPVGVRRMLGIEIGDGVEIYADGGDVIPVSYTHLTLPTKA